MYIYVCTHVIFRAGGAPQQLIRVERAYLFYESGPVRGGPVARVESKVAHGFPHILVAHQATRSRVQGAESGHQSDRFFGMIVEDSQQLARVTAFHEIPYVDVAVPRVDIFHSIRHVLQSLGYAFHQQFVIALFHVLRKIGSN